MIGSNYKAQRDNVIDIAESYLRNRTEFDLAIRSKEGDGIDLEFLKNRINNLKKGKFTIAVAGEVKAGKSTFINALLGIEILPSDVLQATSAVVEILRSEKSYLKVKYADNKEEILDFSPQDINEAREKLEVICKIPDEYRDIPTTLIDQYIIASENKFDLTDDFIKQLEKESSLYGLSDKKELLRKYLSEREKSSIPIEIQFGYPLSWDFDELRIVDTPGVNAVGGVQNISFGYLITANAILFLHPIKPIESESFVKFVKKTISNRSRETLFLILTHAGLYTEAEVKRLYEDAIRIYSEFIPKERIIVVDSLLQLIVNDLNNGKKLEDIENKSEQKSDILAKFEKRAKKEGKPLLEVLEEYSGFNKMYESINTFAMQAPTIQLKEILQMVKDGYLYQEKMYESNIKLLESKKRDPQEFENEINRIKNLLEEYKLLLNNTIEDLNREYTGKKAQLQIEIGELKKMCSEMISNGEDFGSVRKAFFDVYDKINTIYEDNCNVIKNKLKVRLEKIGQQFVEDKKITLPKVDINAIEYETKKNAFKKEDNIDIIPIERRLLVSIINIIARFFYGSKKKDGEKEVYDEKRHLELLKNNLITQCYDLINNMPNQIKVFLDEYLKKFLNSVNEKINNRQEALKDLLNKKETNEELIFKINNLNKKKAPIQQELLRIDALLEDLL